MKEIIEKNNQVEKYDRFCTCNALLGFQKHSNTSSRGLYNNIASIIYIQKPSNKQKMSQIEEKPVNNNYL